MDEIPSRCRFFVLGIIPFFGVFVDPIYYIYIYIHIYLGSMYGIYANIKGVY